MQHPHRRAGQPVRAFRDAITGDPLDSPSSSRGTHSPGGVSVLSPGSAGSGGGSPQLRRPPSPILLAPLAVAPQPSAPSPRGRSSVPSSTSAVSVGSPDGASGDSWDEAGVPALESVPVLAGARLRRRSSSARLPPASPLGGGPPGYVPSPAAGVRSGSPSSPAAGSGGGGGGGGGEPATPVRLTVRELRARLDAAGVSHRHVLQRDELEALMVRGAGVGAGSGAGVVETGDEFVMRGVSPGRLASPHRPGAPRRSAPRTPRSASQPPSAGSRGLRSPRSPRSPRAAPQTGVSTPCTGPRCGCASARCGRCVRGWARVVHTCGRALVGGTGPVVVVVAVGHFLPPPPPIHIPAGSFAGGSCAACASSADPAPALCSFFLSAQAAAWGRAHPFPPRLTSSAPC
jgi:hypothetical protein